MSQKHLYGGQAVIEGVMIRGKAYSSIAVRRPSGEIALKIEPLSKLFIGKLRQIPLVRGVMVLAETLVLGMRSLSYSASVAMDQEAQEMPKATLAVMMVISLAFAVGLFFMTPLLVVRSIDSFISSSILSNFIEGAVRLAIFLIYIYLIGRMSEIRKVFAYHGAEHMTIHARENGDPLEVAAVRKYSTAHPRCGTAFLLVVMIVAIIVFTFLGRPSMEWRILSRIVLIPVIAAISYEVIRFSGVHSKNALVKLVTGPSLALQRLTTRQPSDAQIEVAIAAVKEAIAADEGTTGESDLERQNMTQKVPTNTQLPSKS